MSSHESAVYSFFLLSSVPAYEGSTVRLLILLSVGMWVVSSVGCCGKSSYEHSYINVCVATGFQLSR